MSALGRRTFVLVTTAMVAGLQRSGAAEDEEHKARRQAIDAAIERLNQLAPQAALRASR
jgi:hypothetical protein